MPSLFLQSLAFSITLKKYKLCYLKLNRLLIIHHDLMIAKLGAYGFSQDTLQYMRSYLTNKLFNFLFQIHI